MTRRLPNLHRSHWRRFIRLTPDIGAMLTTNSATDPEPRNDGMTPRTVVERLVDYLDSLVGVEVFLSIVQRYRGLSSGERETREGA